MVTPVPRAFHAGRRTRRLFKSSDISTSLITCGVKTQSSAGCLPASARPLCCRPPVWAVATGLEGEWASRQAQVRAAWRRGRQHAGPAAPGPRVQAGAGLAAPARAHPGRSSPAAQRPKGVWTSGRQGRALYVSKRCYFPSFKGVAIILSLTSQTLVR